MLRSLETSEYASWSAVKIAAGSEARHQSEPPITRPRGVSGFGCSGFRGTGSVHPKSVAVCDNEHQQVRYRSLRRISDAV